MNHFFAGCGNRTKLAVRVKRFGKCLALGVAVYLLLPFVLLPVLIGGPEQSDARGARNWISKP